MNIRNLFKPKEKPQNVETLSRAAKFNANSQKVVAELQQRTNYLYQKDIEDWRNAWQRAISVDMPNREMLLDIYEDCMIDLHLCGCIEQRNGFAKMHAFKLINDKDEQDFEAEELLRTPWFDTFLDMVLSSRYYGHSLIEFPAPTEQNGKLTYPEITLIPRKHVIPEFGIVLKRLGDDYKSGINYREQPYADYLIEVGQPRNLGLLLKCCPQVLSKKNMLAFWDGFGEIFGMPIRIARTTSRDNNEISRIESMLQGMGAAFYGVFPEGTDIEFKESSRGDVYNIFDRRIDRANSEISKGILNQTMTIDNGSSLSQSEVHLQVLENVIASDRSLLKNVVNNQLLPMMQKHGFKVEGLTFEWDTDTAYDANKMQEVEQMLINGGFQIDPKYFADKYEIPILGVNSWEASKQMKAFLTDNDPDFFS